MTAAATAHVVDDDAAVRESIQLLLRSRGIRCRVYPDAQAFLEAQHGPGSGCLVVDVRMPGLSGLDLHERLREMGAAMPVIVITGHADVPMAVRALKAGVMDFLEKPFDAQALVDLVHRALALDAQRREERRTLETDRARVALLSDRECEVLCLVAAGHYNRVIAVELGISVSTVEAHRRRIMAKLRARTLYDLVRVAESYFGEGHSTTTTRTPSAE